jgi:hypothetical protein
MSIVFNALCHDLLVFSTTCCASIYGACEEHVEHVEPFYLRQACCFPMSGIVS